MENIVPKVSILVPVFKVPEKYLRKCIRSCMNQTLQNIEIILVDDGSPDNCGAICDEYAHQDARIQVIHKKNEGLAAARNSAFSHATGEYITFLDGDDYFENDTCEAAYDTAIKENVQLVFWNQYSDYNNSSVEIAAFGYKAKQFIGDECKELQARVLDFNGRISQVFCKLINRNFLIEHSIYHCKELKQGAEGFVFNIQLFEFLESAYYLPKYLYHYTYNDKSISHSYDEKNIYYIIQCFEFIEDYVEHCKNADELKQNIYTRMLYVIVTTGITGYFNPENKDSYRNKVRKYREFLSMPLVKKSLKQGDMKKLSLQRRMILMLVNLNFSVGCIALLILGRIRRKQLEKR